MPSRHEFGIYANWPHAFHRRCSTFPHSSGHNCSISIAIPSGPVAFCFGEDRIVVTSSFSKSSVYRFPRRNLFSETFYVCSR